MKRRTFIKLSAVLAAAGVLAACSAEEEVVTSTASTDTASTDTAADTEALAADVQAIVDRGVLQVGVKNAVIGFGYEDPLTGEYTGMEIDLANMIAEKLGVDIEYTAVTPATRTELLDSGDLDCVLATFTVTDERKESWDFTTAYYVDHVTVLVEDASGITDLAGLVGATIGVSSGSTSARSVVEAMIEAGVLTGDGYDSETFDASTWTDGVSFRQFEDYPSISTALSAGEVDAFSVDKSILAVYCTEGRSYIDEEFAPQDYGIATVKGSGMSDFCETLVQDCIADGTMDELVATYNLG
ncbi:MAG: transporter substrate-binding domain-containing protein [Faecalibacterium sp.]